MQGSGTAWIGLGASEAAVVALGRPDPLSDRSLLRQLRDKYLVWDAFFAGERRVDVSPFLLSERLHRQAVAAAEAAVAAVDATARRAHESPEEAARYGYSADVTRLVRASWEAGDRTSFARVDLLLGEDGAWHACEVNADCPGGHNESLGLPLLAIAAGFSGGSCPSTAVDDLAAHLADLARAPDGAQGAVGMIFATAWAEDLQICALLRRRLARLGVSAVFAPPVAPRLEGSTLAIRGTPVRALYRYTPTEYMEGQQNLGDLEEAVARGLVRTASSFAQMYAQSKLAFARAWSLRAALGSEHRLAVERWLPESLDLAEMPPERLIEEREGWVVKRALGRVGDQVFVGALTPPAYWEGLVKEIAALDLAARPGGPAPNAGGGPRETWIAQRFVRQRPISTPYGDRFATLGAYVLNGRFTGYFARITPTSHVSHGALCVPVFVEARDPLRQGAAA